MHEHIQRIGDRLAEIRSEMELIHEDSADRPLTDQDQRRWDELKREADKLVQNREHFVVREEERRQLREQVAANPLARVKGSVGDMDRDPLGDPRDSDPRFSRHTGNPWDIREFRVYGRNPEATASELKARALTAVETCPGMTQRRREVATEIIERYDPAGGQDAGAISRHMLVSTDPDYLRAFSKMLRNERAMLSADEQRAMERAMSLTTTAGGFLVPGQLDPTIILTSDGSVNPIREISRKVVATGNVWTGVSTTHASWSWDVEATGAHAGAYEVSDDATVFAQPSINVYKAQGFIPISIEALADEQNITAVIGEVLARGRDDLEATAFTVGTGSGQPFGVVTAVTGSASSGTTLVATTATGAFAAADVYKLEARLPGKYRRRSSFVANKTVYQTVRQFAATNDGANLWERIGANQPAQLLGYPAYECSDMDSTVSTGTEDSFLLLFGDFSNYVIADRLGMTIETIPHIFGATRGFPIGQRGFFAYYRVGADSVNDLAFRISYDAGSG